MKINEQRKKEENENLEQSFHAVIYQGNYSMNLLLREMNERKEDKVGRKQFCIYTKQNDQNALICQMSSSL